MALNQGSSASRERLTRARSMQWILDNRVDANAASILLALPDHLQENIRRAGMLYNPLHDERNTSAMLRKRINDLCKGAFVEVPGSIRRLATSLVNSQQMPSGASSSSDEYGEVRLAASLVNSQEAILATATSKASSMVTLPVGVKMENVPPWKLLNTITFPGIRFKRPREAATDLPHGLPSQAVKTEDGEVQQRCHYLALRPREVATDVPQLRDQFPLSRPMRDMVLLIRGEGLRVGGRHDHFSHQDLQVLRENLEAYKTHLVDPLQNAGYRVSVVVDVMTDDLRMPDTRMVMDEVLGTSIVLHRISEFLRGLNQLNSVVSSWDFFSYWAEQSPQSETTVGVYAVRADIRLLREGPHAWPTERLGFFWRTKWHCPGGKGVTVNDTLFYVPKGLFRTFRQALHGSDMIGWVDQNLHWLSEHPALSGSVWVQHEMNHPSNTAMEQNPYYVMTGRCVGSWNAGKWRQYELTKPDYDSLRRREVLSFGAQTREDMWADRVRSILRKHGRFAITDFASLWSAEFPDDAIAWFMPFADKLKKSLQVNYVEVGADGQSIQWQSVPPWRGGL